MIVAVLFNGCATTTFYQLYETNSDDVSIRNNDLLYENDDIKVVFNLWENFGNSGFLIYNKTDSSIYIDLKESHLIVNNIAKTYYQNRTFSESSSVLNAHQVQATSSMSSTSGNTNVFNGYGSANIQTNLTGVASSTSSKSQSAVKEESSVTYIEKDIINIPPESAKIFNGFYLNNTLYRDCELLRYPSSKNIKSKSFKKENTPLYFKNIISYGYEPGNLKEIECDFWVSEITNYPKDEFYEKRYPEFCGDKSTYSKNYFLFNKPNRFYINYEKGPVSEFEH